MAFGLTPHFTQQLDLDDLPAKHFLAVGIESAKALEWDIEYISKSGFVAVTPFSFGSGRSSIEVVINGEQATVKSETLGSQMYDWGKNKKRVEAFLSAFESVQANASDEQLNKLIAEFDSSVITDGPDLLDSSRPKTPAKDFFSLFIPGKSFFITPIIIDINILVFVLMVIGGVNVLVPQSSQLLAWGANFRPVVLEGQLWRLLTNTFIHIGIIHLLLNMYALLYIGVLLEPYLGKVRFIAAYLLTGIAGSVMSIYWHPLTISAGASGAIFGMYGVFLALLTTNIVEKKVRKALLTSITIFVLYNLANGLKQGIDNAAHIGGLLSGLIIGFCYLLSFKNPFDIKLKYATVAISIAAIIFMSFLVYRLIPDDTKRYDEAMTKFSMNENSALQIFAMKNVRSDAVILDSLYNKTNVWKANITLLESIDNLQLPEELIIRNSKLKKYCNLRIQSYQYIYNNVEQKTTKYNDSLKICNAKIEAVLNEIKSGSQ